MGTAAPVKGGAATGLVAVSIWSTPVFDIWEAAN
jgi:hypothetical protein